LILINFLSQSVLFQGYFGRNFFCLNRCQRVLYNNEFSFHCGVLFAYLKSLFLDRFIPLLGCPTAIMRFFYRVNVYSVHSKVLSPRMFDALYSQSLGPATLVSYMAWWSMLKDMINIFLTRQATLNASYIPHASLPTVLLCIAG
jgi:hypothetical protein